VVRVPAMYSIGSGFYSGVGNISCGFFHWNIHKLTPGNPHAIANSGDIGN